MWAYRGVSLPLNVFDFTVSRHRNGPDLMRAKFGGTLLADCDSGYQGISPCGDGRVRRATSSEERLAVRQSESAPVSRSPGEWIESQATTDVLPKKRLGKAPGSIRNHQEPLQTYLSDGRTPMDNNEVEQSMKQVAIG
ncbi:MAG: transposase [Phycisphaerae bacterium]|nr:transposase [Phycisphaerae bacterium]